MAFCKEFNAKTQAFKVRNSDAMLCTLLNYLDTTDSLMLRLTQDDVPLPVLVTAYKDRSFDFVRLVPSKDLLRRVSLRLRRSSKARRPPTSLKKLQVRRRRGAVTAHLN